MGGCDGPLSLPPTMVAELWYFHLVVEFEFAHRFRKVIFAMSDSTHFDAFVRYFPQREDTGRVTTTTSDGVMYLTAVV